MKILIINLPRFKGESVIREGRCEMIMEYRVDTPATLLIVASLLREHDFQVDFIDANGFNLNYKTVYNRIKRIKYDCVFFTFYSGMIDYELKICDLIKKINPICITIGYSWYAKKYGREILTEYPNLDVLIIKDPFSVVENLIKSVKKNNELNNVEGIAFRNKNNQIIINSQLSNKKEFNELPIPAYDLLISFKPYYIYSPLLKPYALIYAGKGCPFSCKYCNVANTKYSSRSAESIINELKILRKLGKIKYIWFFDEIFTLNRKKVIDICKRMIQERFRIKWLCDSRVELVDKGLLNLMKRAGCVGISYGVESGSQKILDLMNKKITVEQAKNALKWTREAGILSQLNLILGYMGENKKTIEETKNFIKETIPNLLQITKMMALNDTEFYKLALKKRWITEEVDWKTKLTMKSRFLKNYDPYSLNLWEERNKMYKLLYLNPKWWTFSFKGLIKNPALILPVIGILVMKLIKLKKI